MILTAYGYTALVTLLALATYFMTAARVGAARQRLAVAAPATTGHPEFERHYRVQMNTLEALPLFLPALWLFAWGWGDLWAALAGVVWIVGRLIYMFAYVRDPATRSAGFMTQMASIAVLWIGALIAVVMALAHHASGQAGV